MKNKGFVAWKNASTGFIEATNVDLGDWAFLSSISPVLPIMKHLQIVVWQSIVMAILLFLQRSIDLLEFAIFKKMERIRHLFRK